MPENTDVKTTPVLVTRGSKPSQNADFLSQNDEKKQNVFYSQKLHWIEGTFKSRTAINVPSILTQKRVESRPLNGYAVGTVYEDGRRLDVHPGRPEMGSHMTWNGTACDNCPMDCVDLVKYLQAAEFSFTRLDMAIDAIGFNLKPKHATRELKYGRCKTRAKTSRRNDDPRQVGYTQYIGEMSSEIYLCIYDKAAEMGTDEDHTRVELRTKRARANKAAREVVRGTDFRSLVVAYADFPVWREWKRVMAADPVKLPSERTQTNTQRWLMDQCAPSLARVIFLEGNSEFYERFKDAVMTELKQLSNNRQTEH